MDDAHGQSRSLWLATAAESHFPRLQGNIGADVAVVGAGIAGLTAAALLRQAGATVIVLEADSVGTGVTGHTTAKVTSLHALAYQRLAKSHGLNAAQSYGQANEAGLARIAEFVDSEGIECDFRRRDAYTYTESRSELDSIEAEASMAMRLGLPASFSDSSPLPYPIAGAVCFANQAEFHPTKYLQGLAELVAADKSFVFEKTPVLDIKQGNPCTLHTEGGEVSAKQVVIATHYPLLDPLGLYSLRLHPERSYALAVRVPDRTPEGMFLDAGPPTRSVRSYKSGHEELLIVGGESHRPGENTGVQDHYRVLEHFGRERFGLQSVTYKWSTQDTMPLDGLPYVGKLSPFSNRLFVATGFNKWGLTNGTAAGMMVADAIAGRDNPWAEVFSPNRLSLRASAQPFASEAAWRIKRYTKDRGLPALQRLTSRFAPKASYSTVGRDLNPGQGRIDELGGEKVAVSKDANGVVCVVSPVCTHLGCTVEYNDDEKTWDCPCHGSRFLNDGTVLQGPAKTPLASVMRGGKPTPAAGNGEATGEAR